jgi:hypothetical protein
MIVKKSKTNTMKKNKNTLAGTIITGALALMSAPGNAQSGPSVNDKIVDPSVTSEIRPFHVHFSDEALADLRRRISATKWPSQETVTDATQGVQLATMRALAHYWQTDYNWRKVEATLNALP